jgi:DNA invertase Pin-like site-specific DNA recombinase
VGPKLKRLRCAIYTRKSSEEGLEQTFNSLAAQREACIAFIESQRHEGWRVVDAHYDDGGYSGATLERPALQRLLADIAAGKLDCVVIYKLDRLTRALTDFAKMIEAFDTRGIALVSVTQQFNTTSSMGRLTLNVLLSFAQFEREVTAERIRDKFAASKRKGLWMGGRVPLGYDLKERELRVNPAEATLVRSLYERYLALGCVSKLRTALMAQGMVSKRRLSRRGVASGGVPYSRGALYELLKNRLYLGEIAYRGQIYPGQHEPIVERSLWERVQQHLARGRKARREGTRARVPSLLLGRVYSDSGARYTPTHSSKRDKRYRYYVLQATSPPQAIGGSAARISALDLESLVLQRLHGWLSDPLALLDALTHPGDDTVLAQTLLAAASARARAWPAVASEQVREFVRAVVVKVSIDPGNIRLALSKCALRALLLAVVDNTFYEPEDDLIELSVEACLQRRGRAVRLVVSRNTPGAVQPQDASPLMYTLAQAHQWLAQLLSGEASSLRTIATAVGKSERYVSKVIRLAFLAPDLVEAVLEGPTSSRLTLAKLTDQLPWDWNEQRRRFAVVLGANRTSQHAESAVVPSGAQ